MKKLLVIHFLFFSIGFYAQAPLRFYTKFGGNGIDIGYSGKPTLDKQYIVTGSTSSYGAGNTDVYLVKVDSMGFPIWEMFYGGFNNDVGKSVIQLPDSGFVVAGFTNSFGAGGYDAYILRTDKKGTLIWQKTFGGLDWDFANDLVLASDGGIVVCGNTSSFGAGKKDGLMLKYDLAGNLLWQKIIGGGENEELRSVIKTNDNLLASVGLTQSKGDVNGDCYFVKFDLNGDTLFTKYFGGPGKDHANDIVQKPNSDYFICGAKTYSTNPKTESLMYSMSSTGVFVMENHYYASSTDEEFVSLSNSFQLTSLTAYLRTVPVPNFKMEGNIFLATPLGYYYKINSFCGFEDEILFSVEGTSDGGYLCVGSTLSFNSIGEDVFMIKLDSTLNTYSSVVGIKEKTKNQKTSIFYEENGNIKIVFQDEEIAIEVMIYDLNGKKLKQFFPEGTQIKIDIADLSPAVYLLTVKYKSGKLFNTKLLKR